MSFFITFEGVEGSGKTTQIRKAGAYLTQLGVSCIVTHEPGGTCLGRELRDLLLNRTSLRFSEKAELLLFAADRAQHVEDVILPALQEGKVVLCDRYTDATIAYQGYGRRLDVGAVEFISDFASQSLRPHLTLLFDSPVEIGLKRVRERNQCIADRFEQEEVAFHQRVREGYRVLAARDVERYRIIDGSRRMDIVYEDVCRHLQELLDGELNVFS